MPEKRALQFFYQRTSSQLSGFYSCEFWNTGVLQIASWDDGIRHGLVALASLHEEYEMEGAISLPSSANSFALVQYNLAIRQHLERVQDLDLSGNVEVFVAPCLIFICIEMMRGRFGSVLFLVKKVLDIFDEFLSGAPTSVTRSSQVLLEAFETQLRRLEAQAVGLVGPMAWGNRSRPQIKTSRSRIPESFPSVMEARDSLEFYRHTYTISQTSSNNNNNNHGAANRQIGGHDEVGLYLNVFDRWSTAFRSMNITLSESMTDQDKYASQVLEIHRLGLQSSLDLLSKRPEIDNQMLWDDYTDSFDNAVSIAESLLQKSSAQSVEPSTRKRPFFTLDIGVVGPLYEIAHRCRDPFVRRRAIHLLYTYPRQEGMWDSLLAARVAERVVAIEEGGLGPVRSCTDVPDWARTSDVLPIFDLEHRKAVLSYQRKESAYSHIRAPVQEVIQW
ncbi:hypothetical protein LTR84_003562 [Exophiala bonariae]|uniref:Uncharacterized protein n=1 Tax=Exophiala bonariae TaxID=1690606 RepID=A0AAV9N7N9_9EURO|nr:hypothetical protein LTR84_003562 [Exophiala bonariae]